MSLNESSVNKAIGHIYEAMLDSSLLEQRLLDIAKVIGCHVVHLVNTAPGGDLLFDTMLSSNGEIDLNFKQENATLMSRGLNPRVTFSQRLIRPSIAFDWMHTSEKQMKLDEFYSNVAPGVDAQYYGSLALPGTKNEFAGLGMFRSKRSGHLNDHEMRYLRVLLPHSNRR